MFVIGVLADLSGPRRQDVLPRLRDRRFVTVTVDTFPTLLRRLHPETEGLLSALTTSLTGDEADMPNAWFGLDFLVRHTRADPAVRVKVLDISKRELLRDLRRALEFNDTKIFSKVHGEGIGTFGGEPFCSIIGAFSLDSSRQDREVEEKVAQICDAAAVSFLSNAEPAYLNLSSWSDLNPDFSPAWFLRDTRSRADSDSTHTFLFTQRFRETSPGRETAAPWLDAAFLVGWLITRVFHPADAEAGPGPEIELGPLPAVEMTEKLRRIGLNIIDPKALGNPDLLHDLVPLARSFGLHEPPGLTTRVSYDRLYHELISRVREWQGPESSTSLARRLHAHLRSLGMLSGEIIAVPGFRGRSKLRIYPAQSGGHRVTRRPIAIPPIFIPTPWPDPKDPTSRASRVQIELLLPFPHAERIPGGKPVVDYTKSILEGVWDLMSRRIAMQEYLGWVSCDELIQDRSAIFALGKFVASSRQRSSTVAALARRPRGLSELRWKLEAAREARQPGGPTRIGLRDAVTDADAWMPVGSDDLEWLGPALDVLQKWVTGEDARLTAGDTCTHALRAIDQRIAAALQVVFGHPEFRAMEGAYRAIEECIFALGPDRLAFRPHFLDGVPWFSHAQSGQGAATLYDESRKERVAREIEEIVRTVESTAPGSSAWPSMVLADLSCGFALEYQTQLRLLAAAADAAAIPLLLGVPASMAAASDDTRVQLDALREYRTVVLVKGWFEPHIPQQENLDFPRDFTQIALGDDRLKASMVYRVAGTLAQCWLDARLPQPVEPFGEHGSAGHAFLRDAVLRAAGCLGLRSGDWGNGLVVDGSNEDTWEV